MLGTVSESAGTNRYHGPSTLPDGRSLIYTLLPGRLDWSEAEIRLLDLRTGEDRLIYAGGTDVRYVKTGHLVFFRRGSLYAIPFDVDRRALAGDELPVMDQVAFSNSATTGAAQASISDNGTLVKVRGSADQSGSTTAQVSWATDDDTVAPVSPDKREFFTPRISPTGTHIAVQQEFGVDERSVLVLDAIRGTQEHSIEGAGMPVWSPDGQRLLYGQGNHLLIRSLSDWKSVDTLLSAERRVDPTDWSSDGRYIVYNEESVGMANTSIRWFDMESGQNTAFLDNDVDIDYARFSPDGKWIAFEYGPVASSLAVIRQFPGGGNRLQVAPIRGAKPLWRRDGKAILYSNESSHIVETELDLETMVASPPVTIFTRGRLYFELFDIHPDDGRLLVVTDGSGASNDQTTSTRIILDVVVNWTSELPAWR